MPDDALIHATSYQHEIRRASEDSAALLFFFYVNRECFFNRTNTDAPCISSSDACLLWLWTHAQENLGDVEKDGDRKKQNTPPDHWWLQQEDKERGGKEGPCFFFSFFLRKEGPCHCLVVIL